MQYDPPPQPPPGSDPEVQIGLQTLNIVDVVLSVLSLFGSTGIIASFVYFRFLRKIRHKLILGLAVADFVESIAVLSPSAHDLVNGRISDNSAGCQAAGFLYLASIWANSLWTLAIALATYCILVHPLSMATIWLETRAFQILLWTIIWGICLVNAGIGVAVYPVIDVGGLCFWAQNAGLYADLILVIPRASILLIVIVLYIRLYFFFRRQRITNFSNCSEIKASDDLPDFGPTPNYDRRRSSTVNWAKHQYRKFSKDSDTGMAESASPFKARQSRRESEVSLLRSIPLAPQTPVATETSADHGPLEWSTFRWPHKELQTTQSDTEVDMAALQPVSVLKDGAHSSSDLGRIESGVEADTAVPTAAQLDERSRSMSILGSSASLQTSQRNKLPKMLSPADLNRRASSLMLLYPAAYVVLFSASIGRLFVHIANPMHDHSATTALGAISRWFVLASGFVDALIFLVIETIFRRQTRRKPMVSTTDS